MALMLCTEFEQGISKPSFQQWLLMLARRVLHHAFDGSQTLDTKPEFDPSSLIIPKDYQPLLNQRACCFVTLHTLGQLPQLRGCIGSLSPTQNLLADVIVHTYAAGFADRRFLPLAEQEVDGLSIEISILSTTEEIKCTGEQQLLNQLRPFEDGLILQAGQQKATFLPSVWQQLPDKQQFVCHLKEKAGLEPNAWPDNMKAYRYKTISFHES